MDMDIRKNMEKIEMKEAWLWLCSLPGLYRRDLGRLLQYFGTPEEVMRARPEEIRLLPFLKEPQKEVLCSQKKEPDWEKRFHKLQERGIQFISCTEPDYPQRLLELPDYPFGLFYRGRLPENGARTVAVVGARMCTNYGRKAAADLAQVLAEQGIALVSGMAAGIDGIAQSACLESGGVSYAVSGCGVDLCYPREHFSLYQALLERGGVLSEYPPGAAPMPFHFPMRNRIISGLAEKVVVVEAKQKSGSLITADLALEQGRDVLAVPGRMYDPVSAGCNQLIAQGAGILWEPQELLRQLGLEPEEKKKTKKKSNPLASSENMVYICLDFQPMGLNEIVKSVKLPPEEVMRALTGLQMKGLAEETAKNHYAKKA